jgi:hypothetical protein
MKLLVLAFLFPLVFYLPSSKFFFVQTELDPRNALVGGTVKEAGYNGVFKAGFSNKWFRAAAFFEIFPKIHYNSMGVNLTGFLNYDKKFQQGAGIQISIIDKPKQSTPSLGVNGILEYHFGQFFVSSRAELKMRTDWDITVFSGFVGLGYKI